MDLERAHRTLGQILRSDDSSDPSSWVQKVNAAVFEINVAKNRITGVAPYYAMYGRNPRVPLDVFFPDNHVQGVLKWTNFVLNLSGIFENLEKTKLKSLLDRDNPGMPNDRLFYETVLYNNHIGRLKYILQNY